MPTLLFMKSAFPYMQTYPPRKALSARNEVLI